MDNFYLTAVVAELSPEISNKTAVKITMAGYTLSIDLRLPGKVLMASLDPAVSALYLADTDRARGLTSSHHPFESFLRKRLTGAKLISISKALSDRIVYISFESRDAGGDMSRYRLVFALTGRSSNAYVTNEEGVIETTLNDRGGFSIGDRLETESEAASSADDFLNALDPAATQEEILEKFFGAKSIFGPLLEKEFIARCREAAPAAAFKSLIDDLYHKEPVALIYSRNPLNEVGAKAMSLKSDLLLSRIEMAQARDMLRFEFASLSQAADRFYQARERAKIFLDELASLKRLLASEIKKREATMKAIESDRERFDAPDRLKQFGDLLLASLRTASVEGGAARVVDYYDPNQPEIEIPVEQGATLQQAANDYFARYQKARRAQAAIASREAAVAAPLAALKDLLEQLEAGPTAERLVSVKPKAEKLLGVKIGKPSRKKARGRSEKAQGRRFQSSDGYQIVVGRNDRENDFITFRMARPQDIWLHAADYPGSHVVIKNPRREEVPHRTIKEAAEVAAFYSQAKREAKAAVHYTSKKFVSKPPRAHPGLVRLSSFKTILVEPRSDLEKLES